MSIKLSIIIPCFNEIELGILSRNLKEYSKIKDIEIICVDGGSHDKTIELIKKYPSVILIHDTGSRVKLLNSGIKVSRAELIILHHPRSHIDFSDLLELLELKQFTWGALSHQFDANHPLLSFTSWYSNKIRGDLLDIFYLDHCFVISKKIMDEVGEFPDVEIFEDTEISKILQKFGKSKRLVQKSHTSAVRFLKNGVLKQAIFNQAIKIGYHLNIDHKLINKAYEWGINLNSKSNRPIAKRKK
jgi:glycosyltransferase involved in cell wall biosynthesis